MRKKLIYFVISCLLASCMNAPVSNAGNGQQNDNMILTGAERTKILWWSGKRVAIVANQTSTIGSTHLVDSLLSLGINIVKVFGPEHGFRGEAGAGL